MRLWVGAQFVIILFSIVIDLDLVDPLELKPDLEMLKKVKDEPHEPITAFSPTVTGIVMTIAKHLVNLINRWTNYAGTLATQSSVSAVFPRVELMDCGLFE